MEVLTILAIGFVCCACFLMGVKVGKGEQVTVPEVPVKAVKKQETAQLDQKQFETLMHNVDVYDGTSYGQMDVPGR